MIEKAIRKHINIYNDRFPNKSLDEFVAAVKAELEASYHLSTGLAPSSLLISKKEFDKLAQFDDDEAVVKFRESAEKLPPIPKVTEENFGDLLIEGMEQALDHAEEVTGLNPFLLTMGNSGNNEFTKAAKIQRLVNFLKMHEEDDEI